MSLYRWRSSQSFGKPEMCRALSSYEWPWPGKYLASEKPCRTSSMLQKTPLPPSMQPLPPSMQPLPPSMHPLPPTHFPIPPLKAEASPPFQAEASPPPFQAEASPPPFQDGTPFSPPLKAEASPPFQAEASPQPSHAAGTPFSTPFHAAGIDGPPFQQPPSPFQ